MAVKTYSTQNCRTQMSEPSKYALYWASWNMGMKWKKPTNHNGGTHQPSQATWCQPAPPLSVAPSPLIIFPCLLLTATFGP